MKKIIINYRSNIYLISFDDNADHEKWHRHWKQHLDATGDGVSFMGLLRRFGAEEIEAEQWNDYDMEYMDYEELIPF
ncbi:MAG: hypothetical protein GY861_02650 [bacterium]|nr:hypothetical protein [bacterium]